MATLTSSSERVISSQVVADPYHMDFQFLVVMKSNGIMLDRCFMEVMIAELCQRA